MVLKYSRIHNELFERAFSWNIQFFRLTSIVQKQDERIICWGIKDEKYWIEEKIIKKNHRTEGVS